ncbi:pyridoxal phosphate-dependent aminotransferase [Orrella sp. 11846]|uniref:pyridoxal phosphate-dependent aminotransferase n=1 Tax=Orrella sp. 11846 TaxID=3409913 RepID=UPI003B58C30C
MKYPKPATRTRHILPFQAMSIFKRSAELAAQGKDIISLGIGEPDFSAPPAVVQALNKAAQASLGRYTPALGIMPLREAIAQFYAQTFDAPVDPARVIVTAGASGALQLATMALVNPGQNVLVPDPYYPPNINFVTAAGGHAKIIPTQAKDGFQPTCAQIDSLWDDKTGGIMLASPSNPTGTSLQPDTVKEILNYVQSRHGFAIMDEIYLGLSYGQTRHSALRLSDDFIILNSFSKYFHMTGWRLGWMIVPPHLVEPIEDLTSNLTICPPSLSQHAALACFTPDSLAIFEQRRQAFKARRDFLVEALNQMGMTVPVVPDGAFYVYADISRFSNDSDHLASQLLEQGGVAVVPGADFGPTHAKRMIRLSYTIGMDRLQKAVERMRQVLIGSGPSA